LPNPCLAGSDSRDLDLVAVGRDLAGIGEEFRDRFGVQGFEARTVGGKEPFDRECPGIVE
jgi:hypothetical protein